MSKRYTKQDDLPKFPAVILIVWVPIITFIIARWFL